MSLPELMVLRHGETEWNALGRLQGALDSPLTPIGVGQAARQNAILRDCGVAGWHWFTSPQGRAQRTAEIAAQGLNAVIVADRRLREIGLGDWAGCLRGDLAGQLPQLFEDEGLGWYDHAPRGEGLMALEDRCRSFLEELRGPSVIVTHGITSRVLRCLALGLRAEAFETLPGGQGVVHRIEGGRAEVIG